MNVRLKTIFFLLFSLSGFSGLIYESIWSHYVKLFLGHAAYAQTLVLAIYMGGMALGAWLCSRYSARWKNLLLGYALVESVIGIFALVFHSAFDQIVRFSYTEIIPHLGSPAVANAYQWTLSALLILPQSILIGMPFPLMSAGIARMYPKNIGRSISILYFANTIGGAIGVLASGFLLIKYMGMPGTIRVAGLINLSLAVVVWRLVRKQRFDPIVPESRTLDFGVPPKYGWYRFLLCISMLTGTASFIYELGWIRMLSLVLGSSTRAFELMLSAFLFGLAFGALWLQQRIDRIPAPLRFLAAVQIMMGLLALGTLPVYGQSFDVMRWVMASLSKTETGYALFNLSSHLIALSVMLPATFCAGMTLPLITFSLIDRGQGERSIGAVYAANTIGAIIGIFFAVHVGMPFLGLKGLITFGACLDIALGLLLLWKTAGSLGSYGRIASTTGLCVFLIAATIFFVRIDPYKMASGVYRNTGLLTPENSAILYQQDGKTATITLSMLDDILLNIRTNGKVDAGITTGMELEPTADEITMVLAAAIPMALHPEAESAANIGMGSGLTTHTLLGSPRFKHVDTVEIERCMVDAAKGFGDRVRLTFTDPRSAIHIDDAKAFFSIHNKQYDLIISEPSNPWISGVSTLFSTEFYRLINRHLTEKGLFVQWVQLYEIDISLVSSILKAVSAGFSDFDVYATNDTNLLIIARNKGAIDDPDPSLFNIPPIAAALKRIGVSSLQDIEIRKIADKTVLSRLLDTNTIPANSDYYPVLDQNAARTLFLKTDAVEIHGLANDALPAMEMLMGSRFAWEQTDVNPSSYYSKSVAAHCAMGLRDYFVQGDFSLNYDVPPEARQEAEQVRSLFQGRAAGLNQDNRFDCLFHTVIRMVPYLRSPELDAVWKSLERGRGDSALTPVEKKWVSLFKAAGKRNAQAMVSASAALLEDGLPLHQGATQYAVVSGMLGYLAQGNREGSLQLWRQYGAMLCGNKEPGLLLRLLAAQSLP